MIHWYESKNCSLISRTQLWKKEICEFYSDISYSVKRYLAEMQNANVSCAIFADWSRKFIKRAILQILTEINRIIQQYK